MNKKAMFIGCLLEVVREQYTDFYRGKERWRYLLPALSIRDLSKSRLEKIKMVYNHGREDRKWRIRIL